VGKKILIAFDDSENAIRAVKFIVETFSPQNKITLFSVVQDTAALCDMNSPELTPYFRDQQGNFCALEEKKKSLISEALAQATALLQEAGFPEGNISVKVNHKASGVARDIIAEARTGYDLVVLGRRGITGIREFFFGSVSQKVLHGAGDISILVIN
jgi:nucleotide-binding universal stress UspA family protein